MEAAVVRYLIMPLKSVCVPVEISSVEVYTARPVEELFVLVCREGKWGLLCVGYYHGYITLFAIILNLLNSSKSMYTYFFLRT